MFRTSITFKGGQEPQAEGKDREARIFIEYRSPEELKKMVVSDYENVIVWAKKLGWPRDSEKEEGGRAIDSNKAEWRRTWVTLVQDKS